MAMLTFRRSGDSDVEFESEVIPRVGDHVVLLNGEQAYKVKDVYLDWREFQEGTIEPKVFILARPWLGGCRRRSAGGRGHQRMRAPVREMSAGHPKTTANDD
jgi:hypothetical protein